ncbi:hypothetical protein MtrunA17_Chr5g0425721 [Medicago truncatula]|uniref:Transmembrane protein, putative n=1 Tax=Medicago truncatula TaxID=3880 RepID=G7KAB3_MEDTR|nr:transmembrane protein, putative [Medicago truncatula]RHN56100.1 hypothetical protein MtrunA17_Chr5g0425721 [Medicago truncatula]
MRFSVDWRLYIQRLVFFVYVVVSFPPSIAICFHSKVSYMKSFISAISSSLSVVRPPPESPVRDIFKLRNLLKGAGIIVSQQQLKDVPHPPDLVFLQPPPKTIIEQQVKPLLTKGLFNV